ncbi:BT4734/BF3469 family protein [Ralstonia mannitolilytica]|uniref:BT4734/BF3469 family protein n=1 Tax=Ralstonia mannitolilytica TaxID=105219 RepID=UPI0015E06040|nr:BT4734/BF3469 family protein [Ralstonia mannitolilytica]
MHPTLETTRQSIETIIQSVRDGVYENRINRIRATEDDAKRKKLKQDTMPVFYPTVQPSADTRLGEDSTPTGIVQFDIDKKDNQGLDMNALRNAVTKHPACIYAFMSPSGGLKFGLLTDFARTPGEAIDTTKQRFKRAYDLCLQRIRQHCRIRFKDDRQVRSLRQSCFLSHDPDAFFCTDCKPLLINDQCQAPPPVPFTESIVDIPTVQMLLGYIPDDLSYEGRFRVNACVLYMLRRSGIQLLKNHWRTDDPAKLARDLEDALRGATYGTIYMLQSYAAEYGKYKPSNGGTARRYIQPEPCDYALPPLSTPAEATAKLQSIIREFVTGKASHFVKVTTGAGKTRTVLEALSREVGHNKKVLFLVPTHELGDQIIKTYNEIRAADVANADTLRGKLQRPTIVSFYGRKTLCENKQAREALEDHGVSIPVQYCLSHCPFQGNCAYTLQFNTMENIRVMTHNEWSNEQAAWFNGSRATDKGGVEPNGNRFPWVPDYIVIDEDILKLGDVQKEPASRRFPSIARIINSVLAGESLQDAVWTHHEQVLRDAANNDKPARPSLKLSLAEYRNVYLQNQAESQYSEIVARLESYIRSDDATLLDGMWVEDNEIKWLPLPTPAERYEGIPTLYLDATAHPAVVQQLLPGVQFHSIAVRQHDDVRLFQLSNKTVTKQWLKQPENIETLAEGLIEIAKPYTNVGLITYKQIGDDSSFVATLAAKIGASSNYAHFGDLRGIDAMKNVDCLLVVGRYSLPPKSIQDYARAVFASDAKSEKPTYADQPVRMKDGRTFRLNSQIATDPWHQVIYEHTSQSETLQAIGRARTVHGPKKDIYVFSNENLSISTEVAGFFPFDQYFKQRKNLVAPDALERVRERGFVQLIPKDLIPQLGLTASQVKTSAQKERIADELAEDGAIRIDVKVKHQKGKIGPRSYMVFDMAKLEQALADDGAQLLEWHAVASDECLTD